MDSKIIEDISTASERGEIFAYFGYGSLVNRATHRTRILGAVPATVRGWRRHWQARPDISEAAIALLSVKAESDAGHTLPGLLVFDHIDNLPALDEREAGYDRRVVDADKLEIGHDVAFDGPVYIYEARPPAAPELKHGILQSYLDAVLQGYLVEYGEDAVRRFILDTHAFDTPVIRDRHAPRYPRPVSLSEAELSLIDDFLGQHGVTYLETD